MANSNIDNIIDKIRMDSNESAEKIIREAKIKAREIIEKARHEAEFESREIEKRSGEEAEVIALKQAEITSLKARDKILSAKNEIVNKIFGMANKKLLDLSDEDYLKSIRKNLERLNAKDFCLVIPERRKEYILQNSDYKISDEKIEEGYKIDLGDIVYNNNFKDLIDDQYFKFDNKYFEGLF